MDVVVLGSLNMDLVAQVPHLPKPGETLLGKSFATIPGGKGGNQAVAAARLGARTAMVGRVGNDEMGKALRSRLADENINTQGVNISPRASSGTALIAVSPSNNQIVVVPGANAEVDDTELDALMYYFEQARVLLLQFEIPLDMVEKAAALGYTAGLTVIVDPAPAQGPLPVDVCEYISILTPNQTEAAILTGQPVEDVKGAIAAAETLQREGIETVIVKMGGMGCVCATAAGSFAVPVFPVDAIDTVAAGDAFNGGLAAALCEFERTPGQPFPPSILKDAINYASAVAAISVTRNGGQTSMPTSAEVEEFLKFKRV
ncbi:MAG: ribokinase [Cyanobacteria bacterium P01_F01_bin.3]